MNWHPSSACLLLSLLVCVQAEDTSKTTARGSGARPEPAHARRWPGVVYWQDRIPDEPWSVHVVKIDRAQPDLKLVTGLARNTVVGLATLGSMIRSVPKDWGKPIAGINGDFYEVDRGSFAGDPRGIQILNGELVSGPGDQMAFWIDAAGQPHVQTIVSRFSLTWPDGSKSPLKINEQRGMKEVVLYTPRLGTSTRAPGGREVVLEAEGEGPWLPLAAAKDYRARIISINDNGDTPLQPGKLVLSFGQKVTRSAGLAVGATVLLSTSTEPELTGVQMAIGGGNHMVQGGKAQTFDMPAGGAYKYRSVVERHPRSAVGFNATHLFLVQVDGRQPELSVGMTLEELGRYMQRLGCQEAINLDGGASSTLWLDGKVVNSPSSGGERDIGNSLILLRKPAPLPESRVGP
ncbi:MAG: phosphodiester glycosidase family protein [Verrucomicrobiales bacterium]|nr:phosphodiester glycosidase family protein [Verrucomicrobiales bacterium]